MVLASVGTLWYWQVQAQFGINSWRHIMVRANAPQIKATCSFQAMTRYADTFIARHLDRGGTIEEMKTFYKSCQMEQNKKTVKVDLMCESCLDCSPHKY